MAVDSVSIFFDSIARPATRSVSENNTLLQANNGQILIVTLLQTVQTAAQSFTSFQVVLNALNQKCPGSRDPSSPASHKCRPQ